MSTFGPVNEESNARYQATITDENGDAVGSGNLSTLELTLYNKATGAIINSRDAQDVLNANNVTVNGSGQLVWDLQPEDNPIINDCLHFEDHVALFKFTWSGGSKKGNHEATIRVENINKVVT